MRKINLAGQKFNMLTVIKEVPKIGKDIKWLCKCDCGNESTVTTDHLKSGHSKSCGCYSRIATSKAKKTHGMSKTRIYNTWSLIIDRCYNSKTPAYKWYGARGIKVCDEWLSFEKFFADMGEPPSKKHSIDRKENDKGYSKDNCYWATDLEQSRNRSSSLFIQYNGEKVALIEFCKMINKKYKTVHLYLKTHGEEKTINFYCG